MIPLVAIVGKSGSGKTRLIEQLLPELTRRGYRVATIKHDAHRFDIDHVGKDSWRHKQAGATQVVISSPCKIALVKDTDHDLDLEEIRSRYFSDSDVDLILAEGYKRDAFPKIEVSRGTGWEDLLCAQADGLLATVGSKPFFTDVPWFEWSDIAGVVDFIEAHFLCPPG